MYYGLQGIRTHRATTLLPVEDECAAMWKSVGKYVGGKVLTAVLVVSAGLAGFWFYQHPDDLAHLWTTLKLSLAWLGFVAVLPWPLFFVVILVVRAESNLASGLMLLGYLACDVLIAFWLAGWSVTGPLDWVLLILGFLAAAIYNFLVCEFIASRIEAA